MRPRVELVELSALTPHEHVHPLRLQAVMEGVLRKGYLEKPIVVEEGLVIVDGHHRYNVLRMLGARMAPVLVIDYERDVDSLHLMLPTKEGDPLDLLGRIRGRPSLMGRIPCTVRDPGIVLDELVRGLYPYKTTIHYTWAKGVASRTPLNALY